MSTSEQQREAPQRTCVGCRQHDDQKALLRFVLAGDPPELVPDVRRRSGGRGVSVHASRRCLESAVRSGALRRGARAAACADADTLARWAGGQYARRAEGLLAAAHRSGHAALGAERVRETMAQRRVALLLVASDGGSSRDELMAAAQRLGSTCVVFADKASLGRIFGRETLAIVAITDLEIAKELQHVTRCAADLIAEAS